MYHATTLHLAAASTRHPLFRLLFPAPACLSTRKHLMTIDSPAAALRTSYILEVCNVRDSSLTPQAKETFYLYRSLEV